MANYTPPFDITNGMLTLISSISEKVGKISVTSNIQAKPHLRKSLTSRKVEIKDI